MMSRQNLLKQFKRNSRDNLENPQRDLSKRIVSRDSRGLQIILFVYLFMISCRSFKNGRHVTCQINSNVPGIQTVLHKRGNTGHLPYSSYAAAPWFLRIIGGHNFRINLIAISLETSDFLYEKGTCCICSSNRYLFLTKKVVNLFLTEHLGGVLSLWLFESPELYWLFYRFFENEELLSQPSNKNCI